MATGEPAGSTLTPDALARHRPVMFRLAVTLSSPDEAEDVVQDATVRAWAKRDQFDVTRGTLRSWLLAIVADQARGRRRRRRHQLVELVDLPLPDRTGVEAGVDLRRLVRRLPPRQRAAVVLHHFVDLPVAEVAVLLGCSVGTVKSALHDARTVLAASLGDSYARDR